MRLGLLLLAALAATGLTDCRTLSAAAVIPRGRWSFVPKVWYSSLLGSDLRGAVDKPDLWVVALVVDYSF